MNEWGFIGQDTLAALGKFATICKFIIGCGLKEKERLVLSIPHSSQPNVMGKGWQKIPYRQKQKKAKQKTLKRVSENNKNLII